MDTPLIESKSRDDLPGVERLLSLSDGVVAIALTLLVLQLKVPALAKVPDANSASQLAAQLGNGGDQLVSYAISFYVIAQFWLAHHRVFRRIAGHQEGLAWWNFAFLFTITIMPFTSNLLGQFGGNPLAVDIFALNLLAASLATQGTLIFGDRKGLLHPTKDFRAAQAAARRVKVIVLVIALSIGLAWVSTDLAKYSWLLIAAAPWAVNRWYERNEGPDRSSVAATEADSEDSVPTLDSDPTDLH
jgi:uncharacterized membrane protein